MKQRRTLLFFWKKNGFFALFFDIKHPLFFCFSPWLSENVYFLLKIGPAWSSKKDPFFRFFRLTFWKKGCKTTFFTLCIISVFYYNTRYFSLTLLLFLFFIDILFIPFDHFHQPLSTDILDPLWTPRFWPWTKSQKFWPRGPKKYLLSVRDFWRKKPLF